VEAESAISVNIQVVLRGVLLLPTKSVAHAISSVASVWERDLAIRHHDNLTLACNPLPGDLDVDVQISRLIFVQCHLDVNDEWHTAFVRA